MMDAKALVTSIGSGLYQFGDRQLERIGDWIDCQKAVNRQICKEQAAADKIAKKKALAQFYATHPTTRSFMTYLKTMPSFMPSLSPANTALNLYFSDIMPQ